MFLSQTIARVVHNVIKHRLMMKAGNKHKQNKKAKKKQQQNTQFSSGNKEWSLCFSCALNKDCDIVKSGVNK